MNGKDLRKQCEALGWYLVRVRGSHHIFAHKDYSYHITIPIHGSKDLPVGTLNDIMKKSGLK